MNVKNKRRIAAKILKVGEKRVWIDNNMLKDVKNAVTKADVASLIKKGAIKARTAIGNSMARSRKIKLQKRKGRLSGPGTRKGKKGARAPRKYQWITKVRAQRNLIRYLRGKKIINTSTFKKCYTLIKGGFFRSRRHIRLYLDERKLNKNEI